MRRALRYLALAYLAYIAIVLLVLLPAMNFLAPWYMQEHYGRKLSTELILFNPFNLALEVRHAKLQEVSGEDFASFDRAAVNLATSSLWRRGVVLDELALEGLNLHLHRLPDGELNVADFMASDPDAAPTPKTAEPAAIPEVTVESLNFTAERIKVTDEFRPSPYSTHLDGLDIHVNQVSTVYREGEPYRLDARDEAGGVFDWEGELSVPDAYSSGTIVMRDISLRPFWRFMAPWLQFELNDGRLDVSCVYQVNWKDGLSYSVSSGEIAVRNIDISALDQQQLPDTGISLGQLNIHGLTVDGDAKTVEVEEVGVEALAVSGWSEGSRVSLVDLFAYQSDEPATDDQPSAWRLNLKQATLGADSRVQWRSEYTEPALLKLSPITVAASNIRWPATGPSDLELKLGINEQATAEVTGQLDPRSGDGELDYQLDDVPLAWFGPNLPQALNAEINGGLASAKGGVKLAKFTPEEVSQEGAIKDFSIVVHGAGDALTRWNSLTWQELQLDLPAKNLAIGEVHLDGYEGRVHILKDGSLNLQRLMSDDDELQNSEPSELAAASKAAPEAGNGKSRGLDQTQAETGTETGTGDSEQSAWQLQLPGIYISASQVDFMDESLPIVFRTVIGDMEGDITGFSSDPNTSATVDIKGSVDGYAPVTLKGTASPLQELPALDLDLNFQGVDLARLTPYSSTYAGYAIDQGILNMSLQYSLAENQLKGDNKVVIDQLKLGDKVDSDRALDLPLKLAIALLTDSNGVIDLAVPVSGDVDDPKFSIGSVVFGAFVNLITKAVTAPFNLLASLIGSDEDLQRIAFGAGATELDATGQGKLDGLAEALKERPRLKLVINGRINPTADVDKLKQQQFREELLAAGLTEQDIDSKSEAWANVISQRFTALPQASDDGEPPSAPLQAKAVQETIALPPGALQSLAQERAAAVKRYLVARGQMAADRAVIAQFKADDDANQFSGTEMALES